MILTKKELEELYTNNKNKFVCEKLGITNPTLMSYLDKFGIKHKGLGKGKKENSTKVKLKF